MERARDELLSAAALACDEDGKGRMRRSIDRPPDVRHCRARSEQLAGTRGCGLAPARKRRGNRRSWLVLGGYCLMAFGLAAVAWFATGVLGADGLQRVLAWPVFVASAMVAGYTAFLFGQAEGRDLWQRAELGLALAARDRAEAESQVERLRADVSELTHLKHVEFSAEFF